MQKYSQSTPDWLYQSPALDHNVLSTIQKELLKVMIHSKENMMVPYSSTFFCYGQTDEDRQRIWETCPTLKQELSRLKLLDTFYFIGFVSVDASKEFPPHIDTLDVGLNIPLYNCDNTYTVWYDAKVLDQPMPDYVIGSALTGAARIVDKKNAVEIGRVEANLPLWINGNVAHRPETHHDKLRMAASIRFYPEPVDENGNLWPHLITQ
jgi:hypothetical protein